MPRLGFALSRNDFAQRIDPDGALLQTGRKRTDEGHALTYPLILRREAFDDLNFADVNSGESHGPFRSLEGAERIGDEHQLIFCR